MRPDFDYICSKCAIRLGGHWPKDHVATMSLGDCERCNVPEMLAHVRNWNWPRTELHAEGNGK
jgi:hypothetical protein